MLNEILQRFPQGYYIQDHDKFYKIKGAQWTQDGWCLVVSELGSNQNKLFKIRDYPVSELPLSEEELKEFQQLDLEAKVAKLYSIGLDDESIANILEIRKGELSEIKENLKITGLFFLDEYAEKKREALRFLNHIFHGQPDTAIMAFLILKDGGKTVNHMFCEVGKMAQAAAAAVEISEQKKADVYVRITTLRHIPISGRGKKEDTFAASALWVDYDSTKLPDFQIRPTMIVRSGNGFHFYFRLKNLLKDIEEIESRNKYLQELLQADSCFDVTHVLRVPGTKNYKNPEQPLNVTIVEETDSFYLPEFIPKTEGLENLPSDLELEELPVDFLESLPSWLRDRIVCGSDEDRSVNDFSVVLSLLELGFTPNQCLSVLFNKEWKVSEKTRERGFAYARMTVLNALKQRNEKTEKHFLSPLLKEKFGYKKKDGSVVLKRAEFSISDLSESILKVFEKEKIEVLDDSEDIWLNFHGRLIKVKKEENEFKSFLMEATGLSSTHWLYRALNDDLPLLLTKVEKKKPYLWRPWCTLLPDQNFTFRLLLEDERVFEISPQGTAFKPNGQDNYWQFRGVFSKAPNIRSMTKSEAMDCLSLLATKLIDNLAASEIDKRLLLAFILAIPLSNEFPFQTKPILHLLGNPGSGKTITLSILTTILTGTDLPIRATVAALTEIAKQEIFLPLDDYDNISRIQNMRETLLTISTGASRYRMKAGIGTKLLLQPIHRIISLTSTEPLEDPMLRRRAFPIEINSRKYRVPNFSESIKWEFKELRDSFWSAYLFFLEKLLLPALRTDGLKEIISHLDEKIDPSFAGLKEFLALLYLILIKLGEMIPNIFKKMDYEMLDKIVKIFNLDSKDEIVARSTFMRILDEIFDYATEFMKLKTNRYILDEGKLEIGWDSTRIFLIGTPTRWCTAIRRITSSREFKTAQDFLTQISKFAALGTEINDQTFQFSDYEVTYLGPSRKQIQIARIRR